MFYVHVPALGLSLAYPTREWADDASRAYARHYEGVRIIEAAGQ